MDYYNKYLKYKNKYLNTKYNIKGGNPYIKDVVQNEIDIIKIKNPNLDLTFLDGFKLLFNEEELYFKKFSINSTILVFLRLLNDEKYFIFKDLFCNNKNKILLVDGMNYTRNESFIFTLKKNLEKFDESKRKEILNYISKTYYRDNFMKDTVWLIKNYLPYVLDGIKKMDNLIEINYDYILIVYFDEDKINLEQFKNTNIYLLNVPCYIKYNNDCDNIYCSDKIVIKIEKNNVDEDNIDFYCKIKQKKDKKEFHRDSDDLFMLLFAYYRTINHYKNIKADINKILFTKNLLINIKINFDKQMIESLFSLLYNEIDILFKSKYLNSSYFFYNNEIKDFINNIYQKIKSPSNENIDLINIYNKMKDEFVNDQNLYHLFHSSDIFKNIFYHNDNKEEQTPIANDFHSSTIVSFSEINNLNKEFNLIDILSTDRYLFITNIINSNYMNLLTKKKFVNINLDYDITNNIINIPLDIMSDRIILFNNINIYKNVNFIFNYMHEFILDICTTFNIEINEIIYKCVSGLLIKCLEHNLPNYEDFYNLIINSKYFSDVDLLYYYSFLYNNQPSSYISTTKINDKNEILFQIIYYLKKIKYVEDRYRILNSCDPSLFNISDYRLLKKINKLIFKSKLKKSKYAQILSIINE
jgi:hypothetical protein